MKYKCVVWALILTIVFQFTLITKVYASVDEHIPLSTTSMSITTLQVQVETYKERIEKATQLITLALELDYSLEHPIIQLAVEELQQSRMEHDYYDALLKAENAKWEEKMKEYPAATTIWLFLKEQGYNDAVCAGILGNIMMEVGGQTLNIQYWLYGNYYGICQWSKGYADVWGKDLNGQLEFLANTIQYELNIYGNKYAKGFDYEDFCELTSPEKAATAFAKCYERCGSLSYSKRKNNAKKAYEYFVN